MTFVGKCCVLFVLLLEKLARQKHPVFVFFVKLRSKLLTSLLTIAGPYVRNRSGIVYCLSWSGVVITIGPVHSRTFARCSGPFLAACVDTRLCLQFPHWRLQRRVLHTAAYSFTNCDLLDFDLKHRACPKLNELGWLVSPKLFAYTATQS